MTNNELHRRGFSDAVVGCERVSPIQARRLFAELMRFDLEKMADDNKTSYVMADDMGLQAPKTVSLSEKQIVPVEIKDLRNPNQGHYTLFAEGAKESCNGMRAIAKLLLELGLSYDLILYEHEGKMINGYVVLRLKEKTIFVNPETNIAYIIHSPFLAQFMHRTTNELLMLVPSGLVSVCEQWRDRENEWTEDIREKLNENNPEKGNQDAQEIIDNTHPTALSTEDLTISKLAKLFPRFRERDEFKKIITRALKKMAETRNLTNYWDLAQLKYDNGHRLVFVYPPEIRRILNDYQQ